VTPFVEVKGEDFPRLIEPRQLLIQSNSLYRLMRILEPNLHIVLSPLRDPPHHHPSKKHGRLPHVRFIIRHPTSMLKTRIHSPRDYFLHGFLHVSAGEEFLVEAVGVAHLGVLGRHGDYCVFVFY